MAGGPEYTAPSQLHDYFLSLNQSFTSQTVKASDWNGQLPAIMITTAANLPNSINANEDWIKACEQLGTINTPDGCRMLIKSDLVVIAGKDLRGAFYGAQTFRALLNNSPTIPAMAIRDWPDLELRSAYILCSNQRAYMLN